MSVLSLSNPRNRATLIAVLLLMEFMAVLWLRDSNPTEGARAPTLHYAQDDLQYRQQEQHLRQGQRREDVYIYGSTGKDSIESEEIVLRVRAGPVPAVSAPPTASSSGAMERKDDTQDEPRLQQNQQRKQHQQRQHEGTSNSVLPEEQTSTSSASISKPTKSGQSNTESNSSKKQIKASKSTKSKGSHHQHHHRRPHPAHVKNQRGGFKSTKERKLAQLIPVLDENGVVIEDHFISPRDSNGDGIPDLYVLLRPTANSKYMMDVGLFDEDTAPPRAKVAPIAVSAKPSMVASIVVPVVAPSSPSSSRVVVVPQQQAPSSSVTPISSPPTTSSGPAAIAAVTSTMAVV
ncbi:hypothetical protein BGZ50_008498 [Haplosporangium sp. Z 11]|nr:hypothetical protein BGZ50_008498 [Haplosporangium sp. Z 11]